MSQIEFRGEEGTGLGPTLEFYALVAAELQAKHLGLWLVDDAEPDDQARPVDLGQGIKAAGYYVQRSCGLFPAPRPQATAEMEHVERCFNFLGTFFAKCMQDSRLVDLPLSRPFLKLLCMGDVVDNVAQNYRELLPLVGSPTEEDLTPTEDDKDLDLQRCHLTASTSGSLSTPWYAGLLTQDDFLLVDPHRARFLEQLRALASRKQAILADVALSPAQRKQRLEDLTLTNPPVKLEDLR